MRKSKRIVKKGNMSIRDSGEINGEEGTSGMFRESQPSSSFCVSSSFFCLLILFFLEKSLADGQISPGRVGLACLLVFFPLCGCLLSLLLSYYVLRDRPLFGFSEERKNEIAHLVNNFSQWLCAVPAIAKGLRRCNPEGE